MSESELRHRLAADPDDAEAAQQLADMLMRQEQPVPLDLQETVLRHHLTLDPARDDLGFRLAMILMEQGRPVPATLEMQALRHCIALEPERPDLYDRLSTVTLEVSLAGSRIDRQPLATADDHAIVALAKQHLAAVIAAPARTALPSYGVRWGEYARRIREDIATLDDPVAATRYAQTRIGFEHRLPAAQSLRYMALYDRELRTEFPQYRDLLSRFQDPPQSDPDSQVTLEGRAVSNIVPYQTRIVLSCQSLIPAPQTVLELGGGHGGPARQWLTNPVSPARNLHHRRYPGVAVLRRGVPARHLRLQCRPLRAQRTAPGRGIARAVPRSALPGRSAGRGRKPAGRSDRQYRLIAGNRAKSGSATTSPGSTARMPAFSIR